MALIHILQILMMLVGGAIALGAVVLISGAMLLAVGNDFEKVVQHFIQSRRDTHLLKQIEEFRRDFS